MSNHDGGYGSGMALNDRVARRGPNHQTSHKGHVGQDAQGTSHSLLRTPLFGSAVPRRQRTASVKRPSTSWHDAARQLRQRQAAAVNNNPGRIINRPSPAPVDTQVDTEQEHEVAEALFDLANMFARPSPPEPQRKPSHFSSHPSAARSNGAYSKIHRVRGDQEQYRDQGSLKRQLSLPDREGKRVQTRDWHVKPELPSHSTSQHSAGLADAGPGGTVSTPRAVKAAQHMAAPGHTSLGSAAPVSLGLGAFHPGVPPGLPAYFRNGAQGQSVTNSDGHSGQWGSAGQGQSAGHTAHAREVPDSGMSGAFSKPTEGNPVPRPKSLRRSANHVYIAHMIVEWQHQLSRLRHQKSYQQPAANLPYSASLPYTEPGLARSQSGSGPLAAPRQSSPSAAVKQEQAASLSQQSAPPPAAVPSPATSTFQFAPPAFSLAGMRPPTSQHPPGPRDSSGNIIPPAQYYKNMLGPQKFEALQPRLPLLQPGATWPMGPPGGSSPFVSAPPMLNPQQAAAFAAQMSMFAAAPHSFPGLPGFPSGPLQAQLASSQPGQAGFLRGVRWPDTKEASTLQELPSSASPVVSDAKHAPGKLVKQEDSKGDSPVPAAPGISAEGLERLIAMGRPQGFLDSHNLAQFGVPEHVLQAIKQPHSQQNQDGRALH